MVNVSELADRFVRVRNRYAARDTRMAQVSAIRAGRMSEVAPDLFPEAGPWQEPIVANMIDIAARDMAEMIAPLPTITCNSGGGAVSGRAGERASVRTKIALGYVTNSDLQVQLYSAADWYVTFGFLPIKVEIDYDRSMPVIRAVDPVGCYPEVDRFGRVFAMWQRLLIDRDDLAVKFPEFASQIKDRNGLYGSRDVEVVLYHDKDWDVAFLPSGDPLVLSRVANPIGKVMYRMAARPGMTSIPRGQFDDVIFVQLAKARFALLALQYTHDAVNAPTVVPSDVMDIPYGPGATIRTNNPSGVTRVKTDVSPSAWVEQQNLDREMQIGSRFPQIRTGNMDASVVTGKGAQVLLGGYDVQVRAHQAVFARTLSELVSLCFEVDEKIFGGMRKELRGTAHGSPFEVKYVPSKDIKGDYTVDVQYGLMAGLDPNRWLVFALQARAEKMFSRDFMRRELPVEIDVEEEARKIDIEDLEEAAKQAIMGYVQAIPALAANGQDPSGPLNALVKVISDRRKGRVLADSIVDAFKPEPEPEPAAVDPLAAAAGEPAAAGLGGGGVGASGLMPGVAPGQQGMAPGGRPDLQTMLAGLSAGGAPNISANVQRRQAI